MGGPPWPAVNEGIGSVSRAGGSLRLGAATGGAAVQVINFSICLGWVQADRLSAR